jgi:tRNA A-37 threonylcarbamoyl transferase component Bud32
MLPGTEGFTPPFTITLSRDLRHDARELCCREIIRHLPGKRLVGRGTWRGKEIVAKIYFHKWHARRHWRREQKGIQALTERGISTPALLYAGSTDDDKKFVLILRAITKAKNLLEVWDGTANERERIALLKRLITTVAEQHDSGVLQHDLHLRNFLKKGNEIYTLDGSEIMARNFSLSKSKSLDNLGLLLAQLPPHFDDFAPQMYVHYAKARGWKYDDRDFATLRVRLNRNRERRKKDYLNKVFRESTAFACERNIRWFLVVRKASASAELTALLEDPDAHMADGAKFLKRGRSSTVSMIALGNKRVVIKRYNMKNIWHRLRRVVRRTRAATSWRNSNMLDFYGIDAAPPLAFLEWRFGPLRGRSYFISEYVEGTTAHEYFDSGQLNNDELRAATLALKESLKGLARFRIAHGDLKAPNIIFSAGKPVFTDLDAMHQYRTGFWYRRARRRDIERLLRNWKQRSEMQALFQDLDGGP